MILYYSRLSLLSIGKKIKTIEERPLYEKYQDKTIRCGALSMESIAEEIINIVHDDLFAC